MASNGVQNLKSSATDRNTFFLKVLSLIKSAKGEKGGDITPENSLWLDEEVLRSSHKFGDDGRNMYTDYKNAKELFTDLKSPGQDTVKTEEIPDFIELMGGVLDIDITAIK